MNTAQFERHFKSLYLPLGMYALRIVGDTAEAEDIVEESFMKAWQLISGGYEIDSFKPFMYRMVRNECVDFMRHKHPAESIEGIPEVCEETVDTSVRDAAVWRAIDCLPDRCRTVFLMSKRDGLSNDEIAEELGISVKTVKNQMTKALSRLRESLSDGRKPFFLPFL